MNFFGISSIITALTSVGFGLSVYSGNSRSSENKIWLSLSIVISLWAFSLYSVTSADSQEIARYWQYSLDVFGILIPVFYLKFVLEFLKIKNRHLDIFIYTLTLILLLLSFTNYFKLGVTTTFGFYWVEPGILYFIFPVFFVLCVLISLSYLAKAYWNNKSVIPKSQIINQFLAAFLGFGGGATNFFPQFFNIYPFGNYFVILYVFLVSYGVLRYKYLSSKIISAQLFSGALVLIFLFNLLKSALLGDWLINFFLFVLVLIFSFLLVRGVYKEVAQREEIERLANDLTAANARLKELDKLKSEFVSIASHQLRSPLTAIKGYASLLLDGTYGKISYGAHEAVNKIFQSSQSLVVMVEDFLNISRIEQGKMKYNFETHDIQELIKSVVAEQENNVERRGLKISFTTDKKPPYFVNIDINKIRQVITNLIDNSVKYTPQGSITVSLKKDTVRNKIITCISDTGVGIDKETIPQLFSKFTRAKDANKVNVIGTGLGLYVVKEIVVGHNGRVWVTSDGKGKGSEFYVELDENLEASRVNRVNNFAKNV